MAILFNASEKQYIRLPASKSFVRNTSGATISFHITWDSSVGVGYTARIVSLSTGLSTDSRFAVGIGNGVNAGKMYMEGKALDVDGSASYLTTATIFTNGVGYFIAVVMDFAGRVFRIYKNGLLVETSGTQTWTAGNCSNTANLASIIGSICAESDQWFNGELEDVRIYNRALSAAEILSLFGAKGSDRLIYGMTARYRIREGSGTITGSTSIKDNGINLWHGTPDAFNVSKVYPTYSVGLGIKTCKRLIVSL